jgi:hypothetical protein
VPPVPTENRELRSETWQVIPSHHSLAPNSNTLIAVWEWTSISVITSSLPCPPKAVSMATDGQDGNSKPWQILYGAALQELSADMLPRRIRDAEKEIAEEIKRSDGCQTDHRPLLDALGALRDLETISQAFPLYESGKS